MAYIFENNLGANYSYTQSSIFYYLKVKMVAQGWAVKWFSDGSTLWGSDMLTNPGSGVQGMGNANSWLVMKSPTFSGVSREILFKRGTSGSTYVTVGYSIAGFTGGTAATPTLPADIQYAINNARLYNQGGVSDLQKVIIGVGGAAEGYSWFINCFNISTSAYNNSGLLIYDYLQTGSFSPSDTEPVVWWYNISQPTAVNVINGNWHKSWYLKGTSSESFADISAFILEDSAGVDMMGNLPNPTNNKVDLLPIVLGRGNGYVFPRGIKGISRVVNFCLSGAGYVKNGDALTISSTRDKIATGQIALPWDGTVPLF
jgi:hypothetical protein